MSYSYLSQRRSDRRHSTGRGRAQLFTTITALFLFAVLAAAPHAFAAISDEEELAKFGGAGNGAGQLDVPEGVAADLVTGHVYVAEIGNNRISEFTPWGNFVKAFGWDVSPGAVNEQQEVRVKAASGQFRLTFGASTTGDLAFNAPGSESEGSGSVEAALNALPSIGGAGGEVSVEAVPGTPDGKTPFIYVVAFKGSLAGTNVGQLTATNGTTPLSGGVPSSTLEARTRADGTAGGTGLESCTAESGCKAGSEGAGAGQFNGLQGVAVDANGNLYAREIANRRVQKFDSAGHFLWTAGGEVNKTKSAEGSSTEAEKNLCTQAQLEGGDECGAGIIGNGPGQFGEGFSSGIALCSGTLFVADKDRIQRLNPAGEYEGELPVPGKTVDLLACDPAGGDLYANFQSEAIARRLDASTGEELGKVEVNALHAITTDSVGNLFAGQAIGASSAVLEFDSKGKPLSPDSCCQAPPARFNGLAFNSVGDLYATYFAPFLDSFVRFFGPAPVAFEAAPPVPPSIVGQFASSVDRSGATVAAEINPRFWVDTRYYVEYGTGKCSEGGCGEEKPVPPGALLTSKVLNTPVRSAGIFLEGLKPGTTYHYRFIAESTGGGPVLGEEQTFTTYPVPAAPKTDCPNQVFRTGFSAPLPDCRAYEMVSPVDKNNGDIKALPDVTGFSISLNQSALDGSRFTYSSYRGFANATAAPYNNQYLATRENGVGWSSEKLDPAQESHLANSFENHHKLFSADLCRSWMMFSAEPALAPGAIDGYPDLYRRDNCGKEGYEALIQVPPSVKFGFYPILQGASEDGSDAILISEDKLTPEAASGRWQAYYANGGGLHLLCIGPDGIPSGGHCSGGTSESPAVLGLPYLERLSSLSHAISADGSRVYWTDSGSNEVGAGKVYLRLNPGEEQSEISGGECTEPEKACTLKVSETASSKASRFLGASADGSKALFEITALGAQQGNLYKFDLENPASSTLIAGKGFGVAGMSEDLSHVYFVSEQALPETNGATAGKMNLYLDQEGTKTFIATISRGDPGKVSTSEPVYHAATVSPDGLHLAFTSEESLTGYDNTDLLSGEPDTEVYFYEAGSGGPVCVSCNPSMARPVGRALLLPGANEQFLPTAGSLTLPESSLDTPHVLSNDGQRLFFNSFDALLPRDTNGKRDVYEWEAASSAKECEVLGADLYVESAAGCLSLISSGQSPSDSEVLDASTNGDDVFFTTSSSLLPQDPGLIDVYDARVYGGLPAPPEPPGPCQGEACQFAPPPPNDPTPASASFKGAGNVKPRTRCAKNKIARKGRCVAKKRKQAKKHKRARNASNNRRQGR